MKNKIRNFIINHEGLKIFVEVILYLAEKLLVLYYIIYKPVQRLLIILLIGLIGYFLISYSGHLNSIKENINPPDAQIISSSCDDKSSDLISLEYSIRIKYSVRNIGGNGYVDLEEKIDQQGNVWTKSTRVYLNTNQTAERIQVFDEVSLWGGNFECYVKIVGYSK